ncbi:unnamed protein product [Trypanosoma congolense IL3000]|uniref:WGS project CAEQ00000000 data, annotated contig 822 n=1 Tax=Trypanosoma congolense (strain IL3000) TaxID=1068625 RepID=F9WIQ7_TRYCI|nr:unnamed protein product [Trypanosoma congolense IL3000]
MERPPQRNSSTPVESVDNWVRAGEQIEEFVKKIESAPDAVLWKKEWGRVEALSRTLRELEPARVTTNAVSERGSQIADFWECFQKGLASRVRDLAKQAVGGVARALATAENIVGKLESAERWAKRFDKVFCCCARPPEQAAKAANELKRVKEFLKVLESLLKALGVVVKATEALCTSAVRAPDFVRALGAIGKPLRQK